eukprot:8445057-Pyramimonas_sp.AAC.1
MSAAHRVDCTKKGLERKIREQRITVHGGLRVNEKKASSITSSSKSLPSKRLHSEAWPCTSPRTELAETLRNLARPRREHGGRRGVIP